MYMYLSSKWAKLHICDRKFRALHPTLLPFIFSLIKVGNIKNETKNPQNKPKKRKKNTRVEEGRKKEVEGRKTIDKLEI